MKFLIICNILFGLIVPKYKAQNSPSNKESSQSIISPVTFDAKGIAILNVSKVGEYQLKLNSNTTSTKERGGPVTGVKIGLGHLRTSVKSIGMTDAKGGISLGQLAIGRYFILIPSAAEAKRHNYVGHVTLLK